jgi:hypothetical protein
MELREKKRKEGYEEAKTLGRKGGDLRDPKGWGRSTKRG